MQDPSIRELLNKTFWRNQIMVTVGAFVFALPYCLIMHPMNLYAGNFTGVASLIQTLLVRFTPLELPPTLDLSGIILFCMNVPLLALAWFGVSKRFAVKTIITTFTISFFLSAIPTPSAPVISDKLTAVLVGGVVAGFGSGTILRYGSSGGGLDIVGMYGTKKNPNFSIGKAVLITAAAVFSCCFLLYDFETVIYSAIFTVTSSTMLDRTHYQTVKVAAIIFTHKPEIASVITEELHRGGTTWIGKGIYSGEEMYVYMTVISRYESNRLKRRIHEIDPHSFMVYHKVSEVEGYFQAHLESR